MSNLLGGSEFSPQSGGRTILPSAPGPHALSPILPAAQGSPECVPPMHAAVVLVAKAAMSTAVMHEERIVFFGGIEVSLLSRVVG